MNQATVFLRLDGPMQAWGSSISHAILRDTYDVPSRSGVLGIVCSAMGLDNEAADEHLAVLSHLSMGVRVDRRGVKMSDYHTSGAEAGAQHQGTKNSPPPGVGMLAADGSIKKNSHGYETLQSWRSYLFDASFLVALMGDPSTIRSISKGLQKPCGPLFLGRRCCTPSMDVFAGESDSHTSILEALSSVPWRPRNSSVDLPDGPVENIDLDVVMETTVAEGLPVRDVPISFSHRRFGSRWVTKRTVNVQVGDDLYTTEARQSRPPAIRLPGWKKRRQARLELDKGLCVFCKDMAQEVHHAKYENAGFENIEEDLRSLCRVCHSAVTLIEYADGLGIHRIDPLDPKYRDEIIKHRLQIMEHKRYQKNRR